MAILRPKTVRMFDNDFVPTSYLDIRRLGDFIPTNPVRGFIAEPPSPRRIPKHVILHGNHRSVREGADFRCTWHPIGNVPGYMSKADFRSRIQNDTLR